MKQQPPLSPKRPRSDGPRRSKRRQMTLKPRLEKTQRSLRDLEDDVARIYHQKQKEAETQHREFEKERLQLLEKLQQVEQTKKSKKLELYQNQGTRPPGQVLDRNIPTLPVYSEEMDKETTKETTKVMDKFLESCEQWPSKLNKLSVDLTGKAEDLEREEVENVVRDIVTSVEIKMLKRQMSERDKQPQ